MRFLGLAFTLILVACGGTDDGVEPAQTIEIKPLPDLGTLYLDELSSEQWLNTCQWMVSVQGGSRTVDCVDGMMVTIEPAEACAQKTLRPHCAASVLVDCIQARQDRVCGPEPIECIKYYECARAGQPVVTAMHTNL